jgi:hypothetical protein
MKLHIILLTLAVWFLLPASSFAQKIIPPVVKATPAAPKPASKPAAAPKPKVEKPAAPKPEKPKPEKPASNPKPAKPAPASAKPASVANSPSKSAAPKSSSPAAPKSAQAGTATTYKPHVAAKSAAAAPPSAAKSTTGVTTYTPHAAKTATTAASSASGVKSANGVTTYTPKTSSVAKSANGVTTYTPTRSKTAYSAPGSDWVGSKTSNGGSVLNASGSKSVLQQVNGTRAGMKGVNNAPIPDGKVTVNPNRSLTVETPSGAQYGLRGNGMLDYCGNQGSSVSFHPSGNVSAVHTSTMGITRGVRGNRMISSRQADQSNLVSTGANRGFLQHALTIGKQAFTQNVQYNNGRVFNQLYTRYTHRGTEMLSYTSAQYYPPGFYAWAYKPWDAPVAYQWAWTGDAWYTASSSYFTPSAEYNSGAEWLTDYVLAQLVSSVATEDTADAQAAADASQTTAETAITADQKAALAEEIQRYLRYETAAAAGIPPDVLPFGKTFIVQATADFTLADQTTCTLSAGDVVQLDAPVTDDTVAYTPTVLSTRKGDCAANQAVPISYENLQGFVNTFRSDIDEGLELLRSQQGQYGLPAAPVAAMEPARAVAPTLASDVAPRLSSMLSGLRQQASQTESSTVASTCPSRP